MIFNTSGYLHIGHAKSLETHCNTLQHTATHCNTLQHTATHYGTLQLNTSGYLHIGHAKSLETHCNTLQHTATLCNTLQHTMAHCNSTHQDTCTLGMPNQSASTLEWPRTSREPQTCALTILILSRKIKSTFNSLQHAATHYNMLQRAVTYCNTPAKQDEKYV